MNKFALDISICKVYIAYFVLENLSLCVGSIFHIDCVFALLL